MLGFSKNTKPTSPTDTDTPSIQVHTMKDDLRSKNEGLSEQKTALSQTLSEPSAPTTPPVPTERPVPNKNNLSDKPPQAPLSNDSPFLKTPSSPQKTPPRQNPRPPHRHDPFGLPHDIEAKNKVIQKNDTGKSLFISMGKNKIDDNNDSSLPKITADRPTSNKKKFYILAAGAFFVLLSITAVGFVFRENLKNDLSSQSENQKDSLSSLAEPTFNPLSPEKEPSFTHSLNSPNYLSLSTENVTRQEIVAKINQVAEIIQRERPREITDFVFTDANNNPVAFHIFSVLAELNMGRSFLEQIDEEFFFSLYFDSENNQVHAGISVEITDNGDFMEIIRENEAEMNKIVSLFSFGMNVPASPTFRDSIYNDLPIRYANLDPASGLSIDYAITDGYLLIGTSKNTLRSLIDRKISDGLLINR